MPSNQLPVQGYVDRLLWAEAVAHGYAAPIWMTFRQALDLGGAVRKGEKGSLTVYANTLTRTETDAASGETSEAAADFLKARQPGAASVSVRVSVLA